MAAATEELAVFLTIRDRMTQVLTKVQGSVQGFSKRAVSDFRKWIAEIGRAHLSLAALGVAAGVVGKKLFDAFVDLSKRMVVAAADAADLQESFEIAFKGAIPQAEAAAARIAEISGSVLGVKKEMFGFQNLFVPLGFARDDAAELSAAMVQLGLDIQAHNPLAGKLEDVYEKLRAGILGVGVGLGKLGIEINDQLIAQKALELGIGDATRELTEQEKALIKVRIMIESSADAQGAAARDMDEFEGVVRRLKGGFDELLARIGEPLKAAFLDMIEKMGGVEGALKKVEGFLTAVREIALNVVEAFSKFAESEGFAKTLEDSVKAVALGMQAMGIAAAFAAESVARLAEVALALATIGAEIHKFSPGGLVGDLFGVTDSDAAIAKFSEWGLQVGSVTDSLIGLRNALIALDVTGGGAGAAAGAAAGGAQANASQFGTGMLALIPGPGAGNKSPFAGMMDLIPGPGGQSSTASGVPPGGVMFGVFASAAASAQQAVVKFTEETVKQLAKLHAEMQKQAQNFGAIGDALQFSLTDSLTAFTLSAMSAKDAFKEFARSFLVQIVQMINQALVFQAVSGLFGAVGFPTAGLSQPQLSLGAKGLLAPHGFAGSPVPVKAYASGGVVVGKPHIALFGEAGQAEAVLPLVRGASGQLGGEAPSGRGGDVSINVFPIDHVSTMSWFARNADAIRAVVQSGMSSGGGFRASMLGAL